MLSVTQPGFFVGQESMVLVISVKASEPAPRLPNLLSNWIWEVVSVLAASPCFPSPNWTRLAIDSKTVTSSRTHTCLTSASPSPHLWLLCCHFPNVSRFDYCERHFGRFPSPWGDSLW